jgi:hypothetical protein
MRMYLLKGPISSLRDFKNLFAPPYLNFSGFPMEKILKTIQGGIPLFIVLRRVISGPHPAF